MSMREFQDTLLMIGRQPALIEENTTLVLTQVAERNDAYKILPASITLPGRAGWVATCQYGQDSIGELRQEGCAQPTVEGSERLICIDEDHSPLRRSIQKVRYGSATIVS